MNPRIKELADEAAKFSAIMALPTGESGDKLFVEKFAELIITECLDILEDEDDGGYEGRSVRIASYKIKEHFGVEL